MLWNVTCVILHITFSNRAECYLRLEHYENVVRDCTNALGLTFEKISVYVKTLFRRAKAMKALNRPFEALGKNSARMRIWWGSVRLQRKSWNAAKLRIKRVWLYHLSQSIVTFTLKYTSCQKLSELFLYDRKQHQLYSKRYRITLISYFMPQSFFVLLVSLLFFIFVESRSIFVGPLIAPILDFVWPSPWVSKPCRVMP